MIAQDFDGDVIMIMAPWIEERSSMHIDSRPQVMNTGRHSAIGLGVIGLCLFASLSFIGPPKAFGQVGRARYADVIPAVHRGMVIVDGVYLPPPYLFELSGQELQINDVVFAPDQLDLKEFEAIDSDSTASWSPTRGEGRRRLFGKSPRPDPIDQLWDAAHATAYMDGIVVLAKGKQPLFLECSRSGHDLLIALLAKSSGKPRPEQVFQPPAELSSPEQVEAWNHVIAEFKSTPLFRARALGFVNEVLTAGATGERIVQASLWANSISYPLTLFAMIVVVVAFGHLLSNKPCLEQDPSDSGSVSPETRKVVLKSLLIFGLLSAVDLIWTIAASATGSMREMNPLGNEFIHDPIQLMLFKAISVSVTISLLYSLHRRPIAQIASWWSCLVLTLLTARWLTFHSMFM